MENKWAELKIGFTPMKKITGHNIFLLDAIGACTSIIFLLLIFYFNDSFGLPKNVIASFVIIACAFLISSTTLYLLKPINWQLYVRVVAGLNIGYCFFTIYSVLPHASTLTWLGYVYFTSEVAIIVALAIFEFRMAKY